MRKLLLASVAVIAALLVIACAGLASFVAIYPRVGPAPAVRAEPTPERLARGEYLAGRFAGCLDCHSTRDWRYFSGPIVPGTEGQGGERWGEELGLPGTLYAGNITPAGLGDWTDGEIIRSITSGVTRTGRALFPLMPYASYCGLPAEDLHAIVTYLRTLTPIRSEVPASTLNFPMNLIVRTMPRACGGPASAPNDGWAGDPYLAAGCAECHTTIDDKGQPVRGMEYAGGREFPLPAGGVVRSSNITPDTGTGIGGWNEQAFIARFRAFATESSRRIPVRPGEFNTVMPWTQYALLADEDLRGMYAHLRRVRPVANLVTRFSPPPDR